MADTYYLSGLTQQSQALKLPKARKGGRICVSNPRDCCLGPPVGSGPDIVGYIIETSKVKIPKSWALSPTRICVSNPTGCCDVDAADGQQQVETATVVGTITGSGDATVIVTAPGMTGSPKTISVAVLAGDNAGVVAVKIQAGLAADGDIGTFFTIVNSGSDVVLTAVAAAANDTTMNVSIDNGTCTGLTAAPTSADTLPGIAPGSKVIKNQWNRIALPPGAKIVSTSCKTLSPAGDGMIDFSDHFDTFAHVITATLFIYGVYYVWPMRHVNSNCCLPGGELWGTYDPYANLAWLRFHDGSWYFLGNTGCVGEWPVSFDGFSVTPNSFTCPEPAASWTLS